MTGRLSPDLYVSRSVSREAVPDSPNNDETAERDISFNVPSTGLIRISLSKPMGIVFEPMTDPHNPSQQRGVRICELPPTGAAAATHRLEIDDELLSINDKTVSRMTFDEVMDVLLDAPAEKVDLLFRRKRKSTRDTSSEIRNRITTTGEGKKTSPTVITLPSPPPPPPPPPRSHSFRQNHLETTKERYSLQNRRILDEESVLTGDETMDMNDSTYDRRLYKRRESNLIKGGYDTFTFLDHLIDSICAPILGDTGNDRNKHHRSRSRSRRYYSDDDLEEDDDDYENDGDLSFTEDDTNYSDESESYDHPSPKGRKKISSSSLKKNRIMDVPDDETDDVIEKKYNRGRREVNKQSSLKQNPSSRKPTHHNIRKYSEDKYHKRIPSNDEPETIHEMEYEDDGSPQSLKHKAKDTTVIVVPSKIDLSHGRSRSPILRKDKVEKLSKPNDIQEDSIAKPKPAVAHHESNERVPIKELEYDDQHDIGADVSVMDSVGGPSVFVEKPQRKVQESKGRLVSANIIIEHGKDFPIDLGFTQEEFIQSNPVKFYRFVVCKILNQNEPEKLRLVTKLMEKYKDREEHLIYKLVARYNNNGNEEDRVEYKEGTTFHQKNLEKKRFEEKESPVHRTDDGFQSFNAFPYSGLENDVKDAFGFEPWSFDERINDHIPDNIENDGYDGTNSSYTESDYESIDGTSPVVIAQVSELINYVYGKTTVVGQIDRVSTIMKAYEGREAVLLELLETKALIKANGADSNPMGELPSCIRENPTYQKQSTHPRTPEISQESAIKSPLSNLTMSALSTSNVIDIPKIHDIHPGPVNITAMEKYTNGHHQKRDSPTRQNKDTKKSSLFGFLNGKKKKSNKKASRGVFPSKRGDERKMRPRKMDEMGVVNSDCSV